MQPKAKTLQERMGFRDDELATPKHDEIMLWLDENVERILTLQGPWQYEQKEIDHLRWAAGVTITGCPPERHINIQKIWERPITSGVNNFIIGFVDMEIVADEFKLSFTERKGIYTWDKAPIISRVASYMVEVKPKIESLGEVIRQIRSYQVYSRNSKFYICCPDNRFEKQLASQGIGFIRAEV